MAKSVDVEKSKGLGDTIEKVLIYVSSKGFGNCEGCKKRKEKLNKLFPYAK